MIWGSILLASLCWAFTFGWKWGNFWLKIGFSVISVSFYSLLWERPKITFNLNSILYGAFSALLLYLLFLFGHQIAPLILSEAKIQVRAIYDLGAESNKTAVFFLLFLITGPGEEIFWRGFLQKHLMVRFGGLWGTFISVALYTGVHLFSLNPMLILSSLVAGGFWGGLYLWKKDLLLQISSHSFWSSFIFTVAPIQ